MSDAATALDPTAALEKTLASLSYLLTRSQAHDWQVSQAGVTARRSDVYLLLALDMSDGVSRVGDLATLLMVEPSHVTRQIDRLQSQQLVERTPDPLDGRARRVAITADGAALLARLRGANRAGLRGALHGVAEADIATTVAVLQRLVDRYARQMRTRVLPELAGTEDADLSGAQDTV
ncbi:MarR family winged helix-turn-helix transcriptional regulator [Streptomyces sp. AK02-01A]|uniref:MarR family winged helix-turn-helix transcriptional regulator n=1 Tax=Streptomyces sp. AK02-01A TaxID=3028648 RepID=UPI0029A88EC9|nr:MarR family transcriptional regulator [Streptomyces sp. AK02-01A]MDX3855193.1 MarR family transcriptional regulator [Streptomyces sp. AK02-01A]